MDLFRRQPGAMMNLSKRLRLLREVADVIRNEGYNYDGRKHLIDRHAALECMLITMTALLRKHTYGLKTHNYWKQVMRSKGPEIMSDRRDRELKEKEERIMQGGPRQEQKIPADVPLPRLKDVDAPPDEMERIKSAGSEIMRIIAAGDRRLEIVARVCRKHNADPHKVHQWIEQQQT